uniref:PCI domain-containing protein n=1 Tax=Pyramimonas obovata TaxID=1411642 RepID=A0A7S0R0Q0_9CHLO|mmetsp:Transcript_21723/g.47707  ORF Transcript_21723/g.47707 Transcript_21723/m.47707 type:complete len:484 (+) Transcript_21723:129-1580(+)|eukprot:CAMPEP_0118933742 /NCGR_PEP_ID=MMETSP1169-20130426/12324_1 /TAXON_ID=36882 /ORGANISM="Pyramimonas obovata, Strain CCMP722" /LENGTH=483 /DNA_ID=CAMNT_0006876549 /DNA_START=121 /DNA_END=1572 /DNA_ORIENTATION=+
MTDTDMKDAVVEAPATSGKDAVPEEPDVPTQLKKSVTILEKAVSQKEPRLMGRALRMMGQFRKKLTAPIIDTLLKETLPDGVALKQTLVDAVGADSMAVEGTASKPKEEVIIETEIYCVLVTVLFLIDQKQYETAKAITTAAVKRLDAFNRRSLDILAARIYYYFSWSHECTNSLEDIRSKLLGLLRTATLRHDSLGQEVLLNLLLRNYLHYNLYDMAEKLRSKTEMPESRSNQQYCRYLYYLGRIRAIQLEYTGAKDCLLQASRKAPQAALGFRIEVFKWNVLVRLLLGEIPDRASFRQTGLTKPLQPYFELTRAVRIGDLALFKTVVDKYNATFQKDKTLNLINRLRRNVIRTGLRRINLAYSRISLDDIASKLGLGQTDDAACLVAKAIRDGGIDATLDHVEKCMMSKEVVDIYSTQEPQAAFHSRISFCLDTYNEAVCAMRYPPDAHKKGLESAEARRERLQQEQELAKHIAEEEDGDF